MTRSMSRSNSTPPYAKSSVPPDLAAALAAEPSVQAFFDQLSFTHRKEWVRWIEDAKKPETREARVTKTIDELREGRRTH